MYTVSVFRPQSLEFPCSECTRSILPTFGRAKHANVNAKTIMVHVAYAASGKMTNASMFLIVFKHAVHIYPIGTQEYFFKRFTGVFRQTQYFL